MIPGDLCSWLFQQVPQYDLAQPVEWNTNQLIVIALHDGVVYASNVRAIELSPADRTGNEALFSDLVNDTCAAKLVDCRGGRSE